MELWKTIKGFEKYEVSNTGKVRNAKTKKIINPYVSKEGFFTINIYNNDKKRERKFIHRLVAETFLTDFETWQVVEHKDQNKLNNNVNNLEWVNKGNSISFNKGVHKRAIKRRKPLNMYDLEGNLIKRFESVKQAAQELALNENSISLCARGIVKQYCGRKFEYIMEGK